MRNLIVMLQISIKSLLISFLFVFLLTNKSIANTDVANQWWFNVELIAFKRYLSPSNDENFDYANFSSQFEADIDLMTLNALEASDPDRLYYYLLPLCEDTKKEKPSATNPIPAMDNAEFDTSLNEAVDNNEPELVDEESSQTNINQVNVDRETSFSANEEPKFNFDETLVDEDVSITCVRQSKLDELEQIFANLERWPKEVFASQDFFIDYAHLIPKSSTYLQEYNQKISSQRDISPLLYMGWRQNVQFGINNAPFHKIKAGRLLSLSESLSSTEEDLDKIQALEENNESEFFNILKEKLEQQQAIDWFDDQLEESQDDDIAIDNKFELEGLFKVYLDYVNQVPYLHLESEFKHYRLQNANTPEEQIVEYPFKQRRRIISKQIHYFDHPAFGIVVRLERYYPPVEDEIAELENVVTDDSESQ